MSMSDEPKDESTDDSEQQADEQATDSDQSAGQAEEQPAESDQQAEQAEEQPAGSDQSAEPSEEQPSEGDQPADQAGDQPAESDQAAEQSGDATGGGGGGGGGSGGGVGGGGPADDAVPADSEKKLQVTAEFTQEGGQQFLGDIKLSVYQYDEQKGEEGVQLFGGGVQDWQLFDYKKPSSITTLMLRVASAARIYASARVIEAGGEGIRGVGRSMRTQAVFDFRMPKGDTLLAKFDVELGNVNEIIAAPTAEAAKTKVMNYPEFKTKVMNKLDAQPSGKQTPPQFRVTGKFYTGHLSLVQANAQAAK
jgi:hypothetical protein